MPKTIYVNQTDAARELSISQQMMSQKLAARKIIGARKVGKEWRIPLPVREKESKRGPQSNRMRSREQTWEAVKADIKARVKTGIETHETVSLALKEHSFLPTVDEARTLAKEFNVAVIAEDGVYHDSRTQEDINVHADKRRVWFQLYEALQSLSKMPWTPEEMVGSIPDYQRYRVNGHLKPAMDWLLEFKERWPYDKQE